LPKKLKKYKAKRKKDPEKEEQPHSGFIGKYARSPRRRERTPEEKKEYKKLALLLLGWLVLVASVYFTGIQIEQAHWERNQITEGIPFTPLICFIAGIALFFVWLIFNGGFKKIDVTQYEKPDEMGYDEYCAIIDKIKERQKKAKYYLILFFPFFVVLLVDWYITRLALR